MFDHIGVDPDEEAGRRRSLSTLLTALLASAAGAALGVMAWVTLEEPPARDAPLATLVEFPAPDLAPDQPPPSLPAAPRARGGRSEPDEAREDPPPLVEPPARPLVDAAPPRGTGDGETDGEGDGDLGDPTCPGGRCGPGGTGTDPFGAPAVRVLHHSELEVKRRVDPRYPSAARALALGDQRCLARVTIEPDGAPSAVEVDGCPPVFHAATREALLGWRWYPPKDARQRIRASTTIAVSYRMP